jgi:hypothetical protein
MMKWLPAFFFLIGGSLLAQDMPPLPPLPNQGQASAPATTAPPAAPAPSDNSQSTALPPLPNQAPATNAAPPAAPPLSDQSAGSAPTTAAPSDNNAATATAPETETAAATPEANLPKKKASTGNPFIASKYRPNALFGGWVRAKGGNETSRMAWTSQEILNALIFKKYKLISPEQGKPEEGNYEGQGGRQWREFNFIVPKSKLAVQVYIRQDANKKVWLRVGPDEGVFPAETSLSQAKKMRQADLAVLHLLQKKFGRRLSPNRVVANWEAPYRYSVATADE